MSQTEHEQLNKVYEPHAVEARWYPYWVDLGLFRADAGGEAKKPFSIVIPPPNVTGSLHMGHALNNTLQDILCRFRRMQGYNVLWMPGTDHAGIATQNVVERQLALEGTDRHQIGREAFIERVWKWKEEYGGRITSQLKRLGCSCDWSRERFTMDEGLSRAVREVFVRLYEEGLIYRGDRIINWCPRCLTALADLEVEHESKAGHLWHIRYPLEGQEEGRWLTVATTRPETLLGDSAVAVNSQDARYRGLEGRKVLLPLLNRPIPIIYDDYVDASFGTGALKITPAHDPNDFEIGLRHGLPTVSVMDEHGRMNQNAGPYAGMNRDECRRKVLEDLTALGLLEKTEDYQVALGHCYRCKTVVEPRLSKQWFVSMESLAAPARRAVEEGRTRIVPTGWEKTYFEWLNTIRDWCVSRQIWWGHRIPAWYCDCGEVIVARQTPKECPKCGGKVLTQESDVLDTWFSSALWPFSTLGWPDETPELRLFYPTSILVTAFDILFFWVARMMMTGLHFMGEVPFREVYIHALVRDAEGQKMSKSKGNVIDPLSIIDVFGTDSFRFTLAAFAVQGRDVRLSEERIAGYRNFINKIWNAARFTLMNLTDFFELRADEMQTVPEAASVYDRWILSRLGRVTEDVERALEDLRFNEAAGAVYQFVWHEFCDWYLELIKPVLYERPGSAERRATQAVLHKTLSAILRLLHPFTPFVTEEIWQKLPGTCGGSIMAAEWPERGPRDEAAEDEVALLQQAVAAVRNIRAEMNINPGAEMEAVFLSADAAKRAVLKANEAVVRRLARIGRYEVASPEDRARPRQAATGFAAGVEIFVPLAGLVDFAEEERRLAKELAKAQKELETVARKLANADFVARAPEDIVAKERAREADASGRIVKIKAGLERLRALRREVFS
ncbi:MAG: valine--tRNA ligase [Pseudomonadota bacterium]